MTDTQLPCPFCGGMPEILRGSPNGAVVCRTFNCVMWDNPQPPRAWNTRAPAAGPDQINERHPLADVARRCIVNARLELIGLCISADQEPSVRRFERWLQQALDALRPPAVPVSVAFWLGREA